VNLGSTVSGVVTGKPVSLGGSLGRHDATGRGVFVVACEAAARQGMTLENARVCVQGFGNVGGVAARLFAQAGARIVAVQDHAATLVQENGLDIAALQQHAKMHGTIAGFPQAKALPDPAEFWSIDCDILVPAALEQQITASNALHIRAKIIVEGANGPTTPQADDILRDKGVLVVPDVIANAGGVTVSYFEWVQDFSSFFWTEEEINQRLSRIMREAFAAIWALAEEKKVSLRTAAFIVACTRVLQAREVRGLYP